MAYKNLGQFVEALEGEGELVRIRTYVDPKLEMAEIADPGRRIVDAAGLFLRERDQLGYVVRRKRRVCGEHAGQPHALRARRRPAARRHQGRRDRGAAHLELGPAIHARGILRARREALMAREAAALPAAVRWLHAAPRGHSRRS